MGGYVTAAADCTISCAIKYIIIFVHSTCSWFLLPSP